jgi:hypothetical protein
MLISKVTWFTTMPLTAARRNHGKLQEKASTSSRDQGLLRDVHAP